MLMQGKLDAGAEIQVRDPFRCGSNCINCLLDLIKRILVQMLKSQSTANKLRPIIAHSSLQAKRTNYDLPITIKLCSLKTHINRVNLS